MPVLTQTKGTVVRRGRVSPETAAISRSRNHRFATAIAGDHRMSHATPRLVLDEPMVQYRSKNPTEPPTRQQPSHLRFELGCKHCNRPG